MKDEKDKDLKSEAGVKKEEETTKTVDDSFLDIFEQEMLSTGSEKLSLELDASDDEYTEKIEQYLDNSEIDIDVSKLSDSTPLEELDIDFDNIDLSKIDLSKLRVKGIDLENINIGFDLDKLKLSDYRINPDKINLDNINFDNISLDLGTIISFKDNIKQLKKMNILLPAPIKGPFGYFISNPYQELRNTFKKSYNEILQLTRPAEAFKEQLKGNELIDAKELLNVQKQIASKKESIIKNTELDEKVDDELKKELGENWDNTESVLQEVDAGKNDKQQSKTVKNCLPTNIIFLIFRFIKGLYLRISLMSFKAKFFILSHLAFILFAVNLAYKNLDLINKKIWSEKRVEKVVEDRSLITLAKNSLNPNKRLPGPIVTINDITCTYQDKADNLKNKKLKINLFVEMENHDAQKELYNISSRIKDGVITLIGKKNAFQLSLQITKSHLKIEILDLINKELKTGKALNVYFKDFLFE